MKHRLLTGLAVAPLTFAMLSAGPANAVSGMRVTTLSGAQGWRVSPSNAGTVAISGAVDDPLRKDGSLRLDNLGGGARAQAQLDGGLGTGAWRTFANRRGAAVWWSSRAFGSIPSNQPVTLADVVAAEGSAVAPEQSGDLTPGVPGKAGGGFANERQLALAAAATEPAKAASGSVGMLAGSMVVAAGVAFAGTAMVRRRKGIRR